MTVLDEITMLPQTYYSKSRQHSPNSKFIFFVPILTVHSFTVEYKCRVLKNRTPEIISPRSYLGTNLCFIAWIMLLRCCVRGDLGGISFPVKDKERQRQWAISIHYFVPEEENYLILSNANIPVKTPWWSPRCTKWKFMGSYHYHEWIQIP